MKNKPPYYQAKLPIYPAVNGVKQLGGMQDTYVNLVEVALRHFEQSMSEAPDRKAFVNALCRKFKISTSLGYPWKRIRANAHRFTIAQAMSVADTFLRQLSREYRDFNDLKTWTAQIDRNQLDALTALTENLGQASRKRARQCPEYDLIQYYREIRNRLIHHTNDDTDAMLSRLMLSHSDHFSKHYGLLPNRYENIGYDDYQLLSRSIKYYANILNDGGELDGEKIVATLLKDSKFLRSVRSKKGSGRVDAIVETLRIDFSLDRGQMALARTCLQKFMATDSTSKMRRREAKLAARKALEEKAYAKKAPHKKTSKST